MDIAKYIGLFILKNNFCYVPGLGNIELKRKPAAYNGDALTAPGHEIVLTLGGSINDTLANFIATNEKISIASASNAVRSFVTETKTALHEGKEVALPSLGVFSEVAGKIIFITDPAFKFTPPAIPTTKYAARDTVKEMPFVASKPAPSYKNSSSSSPTNWPRIIIITAVAGILLALVVKGINYLYTNQGKEQTTQTETPVVAQTTPAALPSSQPTINADTIKIADTTKQVAASPAAGAPGSPMGEEHLRVIINTYNTRDKAEKRTHKLVTFGNKAEMIAKDSTTFYVVIPIATSTANKQHVLDSLKRTFNPKEGVTVY